MKMHEGRRGQGMEVTVRVQLEVTTKPNISILTMISL